MLNTNIDIKGKAYEEIVGSNLRGDRGEFFTPRNVMKMVVEMINPNECDKILDSSCGTGGFLVTAMTYVMKIKEKEFSEQLGCNKENWNADAILNFRDLFSEMVFPPNCFSLNVAHNFWFPVVEWALYFQIQYLDLRG